jgi:NAD(P)-dependent dehydrogenase (short-subunit alcohol dehydrogenase family)
MSSTKLDGQVVIITGASAGIGEAAARLLAQEGARVVLAARRKERLEALAGEIEKQGGRALAVITDITSEQDRKRLIEETLKRFGRIDALVNNAGYGQRGPIELVPLENIRRNFETNLFSLIALSQLVIPLMRERGGGRIVNIGSVAGRIARPISSVYDATKHALEAISDGMRAELAPFGIKVILIEPGYIVTEFLQVANEVSQPIMENAGPYAEFFSSFGRAYERIKRIAGQPEDVARVIAHALSVPNPRPRYAVPGHARLLIALKRFLPERLFNRLLMRQMGLSRSATR